MRVYAKDSYLFTYGRELISALWDKIRRDTSLDSKLEAEEKLFHALRSASDRYRRGEVKIEEVEAALERYKRLIWLDLSETSDDRPN